MKKLLSMVAVAIAPLLLSLTSSAGEQSYSAPTFNGTPVDYCLRHGDMSSCGQESANAFCVAQGSVGVRSFKGYIVVPAAITMSGQSCSGQCWAFESITCGEPGPSAASSAGAIVPKGGNAAAIGSHAVDQSSSLEFQTDSAATTVAEQQRRDAEREARQEELRKMQDAASRRMLRGYVSMREISLGQYFEEHIFGDAPFRVFFHMTSNPKEATQLLETGKWHGRDPGGASKAGFPKNWLGTCDEKSRLPRQQDHQGLSFGQIQPGSGGITPPTLRLPPEMDDYAMGCMGHVYLNDGPDRIPLFRYVDPRNGAHFFTTSVQEGSNAQRILGFQSEGPCCFVAAGPVADTKPIYRVVCSETGHFYTPDSFVRDWMVLKENCTDEGIAFYIWN